MVRTYSSHFIETYLWQVYGERKKRWKLKVEVTIVKPASFQHVVLGQKHLCRYSAISGTITGTLLLLTITEHILHRTVEKTFDVSSFHERLYYGKIAAVSVMHMCTVMPT